VVSNENDVIDVRSIGIDSWCIVVAVWDESSRVSRSPWWTIARINSSGIGSEGTSSISGLVWELLDFLSNKIIAFVANTGIKIPVVAGVLWAFHTYSWNPDVSELTEAAAFIPILVESADRCNWILASLSFAVVNFASGASIADSVNEVVSEIANTLLLFIRVDLISSAGYEDAVSIYKRVSGAATACIILGIVSLVLGASLANVLNND
jgi:hypothetical protein